MRLRPIARVFAARSGCVEVARYSRCNERNAKRSRATSEPSKRAILLVILANALAFGFTETGLLPELPAIQKQLHGAGIVSALLESGYLVVAAVSAPTLGKLGDKTGKKGPLLAALATYMVGAVGAGLSPTMAVLVLFRAVQGVGGAMFAISLAVLRDHFDRDEIGVSIGAIVGGFGVGVALGLGFSGVIASSLGWRWLFFIGATLVLAAFVGVAKVVPKSAPHPGERVDALSVVLLASSLASIIAALVVGAAAGWGSPGAVLLFCGFPIFLALWLWRDAESNHPLLKVKMLANARVLLPNLGSLLSGTSMFALFFLVPRLGLPVTRAGLGATMLPLGIGVASGGPLGGFAGRRIGGKWPFVCGMALLALACLLLASAHGAIAAVVVWLFLAGAAFGGVVGVTGTFVAQTVDPSETSVAMALNSLMRLVGGGIGSQIVAAVVAPRGRAGAHASHGALVACFAFVACTSAVGALLALFVPTKEDEREEQPRVTYSASARPTP